MVRDRAPLAQTSLPGWNVNGLFWGLLACIVGLATFLRVTDLGGAPIFLDEDIYFQAAIQTHQLPGVRALLESTDAGYGKPPLPFLLAATVIDLTHQPIVAARAVPAAAGVLTTLLCFVLGAMLGGRWMGLAGAAVYAVSPYAVLHERMYLQDGPMSAIALLAAISGWLALERASWRWTLAAVLASSLAIQLKMSAVGLAVFPLLGWFVFRGRWRQRLPMSAFMTLAPVATYLVLMASPLGKGLTAQNRSLLAPFATVPENLSQLLETLLTYFPGPLVLLLPIGAFLAFRLKSRRWLLALAPIAIWSLPWLLLSRFTPPRYYLPAVPYLCVLAGVGMAGLVSLLGTRSVWLGRVGAVALAGVLIVPGLASWRLVTDYTHASMTTVDDFQNRRGWPAGLPYAQIEEARRAYLPAAGNVIYEVDRQHAVAAAGYEAIANGRARLLRPNDPFPFDSVDAVYYVIDEDRESATASRLSRALKKEPRLELLADARQGTSELGVSLLRLSPAAERSEPRQCGYRLTAGEVDGGVRRPLPTVLGRGSLALTIFSEITSGAVVSGDLVSSGNGQSITVSVADALTQSVAAQGRSTTRLRQEIAEVSTAAAPMTLKSDGGGAFTIRDLAVRLGETGQECVLLRG